MVSDKLPLPLGAEPANADRKNGDRKNADRGLIGLFLCGSLSLQFEKIYGWFQKNDFSPLFPSGKKTQDAIAADRSNPGVDTSFHITTPSGEIKLDLKQFIVTRGTAYLFVPSMASLRGMGGVG